MIPYEDLGKSNQPFFKAYKKRFQHFLESGWYVLGDEVREFEKDFAAYINTNYCTGVASGLDALFISLKTLELPDGAEVIVPSNTYIATVLSIVEAGLKPILVEPDIATYNIDPLKIEASISDKTRCILPVHLYGKCADMDPILEIASQHKLYVIEDAAQAHGAKYKGRMAGSFGNLAAFSFYPTKNLGALGDGGSINSNNSAFDKQIKSLRNYGSSKKYYNEHVGYNSRLDEIQAAFLRIKLKALNEITDHKRKLSNIYFEKLSSSDFILPQQHPDYYDVFHIFNIRHPKRDELKAYLEKNGIKTDIHYPVAPVDQVAMKGILDNFYTPIAKEIHQTTLSLPISFMHTEADIIKVCEVLNQF